MSEEENEGKIKVTDKRRVDAEGNVTGTPEDKAKEKVAAQETEEATVSEAQGAAAGEINFSSFVMSLATQALMQLGEMQGPEGLDIPVDREAARQTIDIINLLDEKTKGNLDESEERLMKEILHNLRMSFVKGS